MKVSELRIGNWLVCLSGNEIQVSVSDFVAIECTIERLHPKPIPLTEEWLLRFGFINHDGEGIEFKRHLPNGNATDLIIEFDGLSQNTLLQRDTESGYVYIENVTHIHQLQNLYFALTGEELEIKHEIL